MTKYNKFFTHDSNAKDSPRLMRLMDEMGLEGYGIYWMLFETLRDRDDYRFPIDVVPVLARRYGVEGEKVMSVIDDYGLFDTDLDGCFYSPELNERMGLMASVSAERRKAGLKSAESRKKPSREQLLNKTAAAVEQEYNKIENNREDFKRTDLDGTNLNETNETNGADGEKVKATPSPIQQASTASHQAHLSYSPHLPHDCPSQEQFSMIMSMFNAEMKDRPIGQIKAIQGRRATLVRARVREFGIQSFAEAVRKAARSDFLCGRNDRGWKMDFDWLIKPTNFPKVLEGRYDNPSTERRYDYGHQAVNQTSDYGRREREAALFRCMLSDGFGQPRGGALRN